MKWIQVCWLYLADDRSNKQHFHWSNLLLSLTTLLIVGLENAAIPTVLVEK